MRVVPTSAAVDSPLGTEAIPDFRVRGLAKVFGKLSPTMQAVVLVAAIGMGGGAAQAGLAKWLGLATAADTDSKIAAMTLKLEAVTKAQQVRDDVDEKHHAEYLTRFEKIDKAQIATAVSLRSIVRQIGQKRAPRAAPKEDESP